MQANSFFLILVMVFLLSACSTFSKSYTLEYEFETGYKHRKLVLALPIGVLEESHDRDRDGFLIRTFRYKDGAEFFIACRDISSQAVIVLDQSSENSARLVKIWGNAGSGNYKNGTCWSRQYRDGFVIGYDFVLPASREAYDHAIHSVHFAR